MKKICTLIVLLVLLSSSSFSQDYFSRDSFKDNKTRLVLLYPTVSSLTGFAYLIDNKIIDIENLELIGLYHKDESYDYQKSLDFLKENDYPYIFMHEVKGELQPDKLFEKNECSDEFYRIFMNSDAILFQGGADIPPMVYNEKTNLLTSIVTPDRHYFDISLLFHLLGGKQNASFVPFLEEKPDYVIYAFCLGMQSINVATGGTLYQDIPSEIYGLNYVEDILDQDEDMIHRNYWSSISRKPGMAGGHLHRVRFLADKFFISELGMSTDDFPLIYSSHHQAVNDLGKDLEISATSMDGKIIEAISHKKYKNLVGVQFHPEKSGLYIPGDSYLYNPAKPDLEYRKILETNKKQSFHRKFWDYFSELFVD